MFPTIEYLAQELKSLIGYGAKPHHVLARPTLRDLAIRKHGEMNARALAQVIISELELAAAGLDDGESYRQLFMLGRRYAHQSAPARRQEAILRLGENVSVEAWRRPEGPEMDYCRHFAKALWNQLSAASPASL